MNWEAKENLSEEKEQDTQIFCILCAINVQIQEMEILLECVSIT